MNNQVSHIGRLPRPPPLSPAHWRPPPSPPGCYDGNGSSYAGAAAVTLSGRPCLSWDDPRINSLQGRAARARNFDLGLLGAHNFCRNPDGAQAPWCFVGPEAAEPCDVPACDAGRSVPATGKARGAAPAASRAPSRRPCAAGGKRARSASFPRFHFFAQFTHDAPRKGKPCTWKAELPFLSQEMKSSKACQEQDVFFSGLTSLRINVARKHKRKKA